MHGFNETTAARWDSLLENMCLGKGVFIRLHSMQECLA